MEKISTTEFTIIPKKEIGVKYFLAIQIEFTFRKNNKSRDKTLIYLK